MDNLAQQFTDLLSLGGDQYILPKREEKFLAFLVCKNLSDLCETGMYILEHIKTAGTNMSNLPDSEMIKLCRNSLMVYFSPKMFIDNSEYGSLPNWAVVENFDKMKTKTAVQIYRLIKRNIVENNNIIKAVNDRNKNFFVKNFGQIFAGVPFEDFLGKFKNFIVSPHVKDEDQEYIWDFFQSLLEIFTNAEDMMESLKEL